MRAILWCEWNLFNVIPGEKKKINLKVYEQIENTATLESFSPQSSGCVLAVSSESEPRSESCLCPTHHARAGTQPDAQTLQNKRTASIQTRNKQTKWNLNLFMVGLYIHT